MSSTALYTTIYPGEEPYIKPWFDSVALQTDKDFDIVIGLDSFTPEQVFKNAGIKFEAKFVQADSGATPAQVRSKAFEIIIAEYDQVIFTDSDDILHPQRVAKAKSLLTDCDLCACALNIIDTDGTDLSTIFPVKESEELPTLLPKANVFGLSNTAYRCELLKKLMPFPPECVMLDWFMVIKAWLLGATIKTTSMPLMQYRQHSANTARVLAPFTTEQILKACTLLKLHYSLLEEHVLPSFTDKAKPFTNASNDLKIFMDSMSSPDTLNRYVRNLNKLDEKHIWWSWIAHPELEEIWKN
ncbi:glycosyltransferase [Maridesulfovibrio frigidus]|uniref:glycosyltransferase n=1 Tax=Maridesulfovibrio frigidus TaxID=340956 RepID=UPI000690899A|nr:glycosyltransferase [Maridesulfovibrio frigidus]